MYGNGGEREIYRELPQKLIPFVRKKVSFNWLILVNGSSQSEPAKMNINQSHCLANQNHEQSKHQPITSLELGSHLRVLVVANQNNGSKVRPIALLELGSHLRVMIVCFFPTKPKSTRETI